MKQALIFIALSLCLSYSLQSQIVSIPDSIFKAKLIAAGVDTGGDSEISFQEALAIDSLDLRAVYEPFPYLGFVDTISSLKGIEAFLNLEFLDISNQKIDTLDVTNNSLLTILKAARVDPLASVNLDNNLLLEELQLQENLNLTSLDISKQANLKILNISITSIPTIGLNNQTNLQKLLGRRYIGNSMDVSNLTNLEILDLHTSNVTALDISNNHKLKDLNAAASLLANIQIAGNDSLTNLTVASTELTSLDLLGAPNLKIVWCGFSKLTSLNVAGLQQLTDLNCSSNQLTTLDVSNNTSLRYLSCEKNELTQITFANNYLMTTVSCYANKLTNLDLTITNSPSLISIEGTDNLFTSLTLEDPNLQFLKLTDNPGLHFLDITYSQGINTLLLQQMSQPIQVCVWTLPFPPTGVQVLDNGSPNITFLNCLINTEDIVNQNIKVYPNPGSNIVHIAFEEQTTSGIDLTLYNSSGRAVIEKKSISDLGEITVNIEAIPQGVYWLELRTDEGRSFKKLVKQ